MTLQQLLNLPGAILIGSRGLGVANEKSDYDIVLPLSSIPLMLQQRIDQGGDFSIGRYFNRLPSRGRGWFFQYVNVSDYKGSIDVIVLENEQDLDPVKFSMDQLKKIPRHLLLNKQIRVSLFQDSLVNYGWLIPQTESFTELPY